MFNGGIDAADEAGRRHAKAVANACVAILRREAEHEFESDGFDISTIDEAVHAVAVDGYTDAIWYTSTAVVEGIESDRMNRIGLGDVGSIRSLESFPVYEAPDGCVGRELFLIGHGAVVDPPTPLTGTPIIVRDPNGVAVIQI